MLQGIILAGCVMVGSGSVLIYFLLRETRRLHAFDRRLAISRQVARNAFARSATATAHRGTRKSLLRDLGLVLVRSISVVVPFGTRERQKLALLLRSAGFQNREALSIFLSIKLLSGIVFGVLAGIWVASTAMGQYMMAGPVGFVAGAVAGGILPEYGVRMRRSTRIGNMSAALPSALDLLVMCLESGLTFERTLLTTSRELESIEKELARELAVLEAELRLGSSHQAVLSDFRDRTDVEGLKDLATALLQSVQYGTPLAQATRNIASGERLNRANRIEEKAQRLPVLMTLPLMLLVLPGTMLLIGGPAFLQAMKTMGSIG